MRWYSLLILAVAAVAHGVLWLPLPLVVQAVAILVLGGLLPGLLLVELSVGQSEARSELLEHVAYAVGGGYAILVLTLLLISYLPGSVPWWLPLLVFDLVLAVLMVSAEFGRRNERRRYSAFRIPRRALVSVFLILLLGGLLRFINLGYAEFLTDEARVILRADALIQGQEEVLFLHRKGPTEILLPAAIFVITGRIDETTARLPFAIASVVGLLGVFLLGRRLLGPVAGWAAAFLLVFDGYLIGFARFVQYQSVVFLLSVLTVLILYRLIQTPVARSRYFALAALFAATGLLSHYDAAMVAIPAIFLLGILFGQERGRWGSLLRMLTPGLLIGLGLLALFYVPFVLHPHFATTYSYLVDQRIAAGDGFPYNNLLNVLRRSVVYNSIYFVLLLMALAGVALVVAYRRGWGRTWGTVVGIVVLLLIGGAWRQDWLVAPCALGLALVWIAPRLKLEERLLWLWFGAPLLLALFFTAHPRTHVYIFFTPWALLAGGVIAQAWAWMHKRLGQRSAVVIGTIAVCAATLLFGGYVWRYFVDHRVEVLRTWETNHPAFYWTPFGRPTTDGLYGFPLANGWKVIGALYAGGVLKGDYETNQRDDLIPGWYTRQQHRCNSTAAWYFAVDTLEFWSTHRQPGEDTLREQGYSRWGVVEVAGAPRLTIYERNAEEPNNAIIHTLRLDDYAQSFDALARPGLPLNPAVIEPPIANPLHVNFDGQIWLEGYNIEYNEPLKPGDSFHLTLFWRAQRPGLPPYKVFNQAYYGDGVMVAQKDGYSVCDRRPTSLWLPGELIVDVYDIPVAADAPAGVYPLYTGFYREDNFERLPVLDEAGNVVHTQVRVTELQVKSEE